MSKSKVCEGSFAPFLSPLKSALYAQGNYSQLAALGRITTHGNIKQESVNNNHKTEMETFLQCDCC